ncbi:MAG: PAS domain-containing protein [Proteobacteria bacterium]|nr:PAS domain-containing protein [Pseudomonadota bacterium]
MSSQADVAAVGERSQTDLGWRIVGLINLYRLLAVVVMICVHLLTQPVPAFGSNLPRLFRGVLLLYFVLAALLAFAGRSHWPGRRTLVLTHALIDAGAISLLMYASGGVASNLGILLVIPVGSMALLAVGREALVIAAIAALAILAQQIASQLAGFCGTGDYLLAGVMGAIIFLVAASAWPVASRLRESEAQVRRQEVDLANLAQLSQYIVQRLRESILVVDPTDRIRLINESAAEMLGDAAAVPGALLGEVSPRLLYLLTTWRTSADLLPGEQPLGTFSAADGARIVEAHFAALGAVEPAPVLIFLEDTGTLAARVQQSKLAALGRLTASIAHEIRNPVGAMSHAAQLLGESTHLGAEDLRMTEIMRNNAQRVSAIVDNVLRLSRRDPPRPERIALAEWCARFREEYCATTQRDPARFQLQVGAPDLETTIDPSQLHQIVWNLCDNAFLHGGRDGEQVVVELLLARVARYGRVCLEVADRGAGVALPDVERIFEPFFTRGTHGTGLGLFLARELAEINGATLLYEARKGGGSIFRLVFADSTRWSAVMLPGTPVL